MIICNSEKLRKSQTLSFENWMPHSFQWLLPKTLGKFIPSDTIWWTAQDPGAEHRLLFLTALAGQELSAACLLQQHSWAGGTMTLPYLTGRVICHSE